MLKAPWRRFLDTIIQTCLGRQDWNGVLGKQNDLLGFLNGQWGPVQLSSLPGGNIGLDFVYQPGGPVPVGATNVYTTEAALWVAVNATMAVTAGPLGLAVDSSLAPATFTSPHNWAGRLWLVQDGTLGNTLTLADGALQTDMPGGSGPTVLVCTCATGPALAFTGARPTFMMTDLFQIQNPGAVPVMNVPTGQIMQVLVGNAASFFKSGAGSIFGLVAGSTLTTLFFTGASNIGNANLVSGAAGTWFNEHDATFAPQVTAGFAGVTNEIRIDLAKEVSFDQAAQPSPVLPLAAMTAQQAIDMHYSPSEGIGANYIVDHNQLDQCMEGSVAAIVYTIPVGFPIGRELTFIDASGGVGGNAFTLTPTAPEQIGAAGAGMAVVYTQVQAKAITIKKTQANTWRVISSTTLV